MRKSLQNRKNNMLKGEVTGEEGWGGNYCGRDKELPFA